MRKLLVHCGLKLPVDRIYRVQNYLNYSQLFLLFALCPHCLKPILGCAGYDVWDRVVIYQANGDIYSPDETSGQPVPRELSHIFQPSKRQTGILFKLITSGQAELVHQISPSPNSEKPTRGGMLGLSEYSRRAASRNGQGYVLRLNSSRKKKQVTS